MTIPRTPTAVTISLRLHRDHNLHHRKRLHLHPSHLNRLPKMVRNLAIRSPTARGTAAIRLDRQVSNPWLQAASPTAPALQTNRIVLATT